MGFIKLNEALAWVAFLDLRGLEVEDDVSTPPRENDDELEGFESRMEAVLVLEGEADVLEVGPLLAVVRVKSLFERLLEVEELERLRFSFELFSPLRLILLLDVAGLRRLPEDPKALEGTDRLVERLVSPIFKVDLRTVLGELLLLDSVLFKDLELELMLDREPPFRFRLDMGFLSVNRLRLSLGAITLESSSRLLLRKFFVKSLILLKVPRF